MAASEATAGSGDERKITCCAALFLSSLRSRAMARDLRVRVRGILDGVVVKFLMINTVAGHIKMLLRSQGFKLEHSGPCSSPVFWSAVGETRDRRSKSALTFAHAITFDIVMRRGQIAGRDMLRQTSLGFSNHSKLGCLDSGTAITAQQLAMII
jgi:hypothetical protein